MGNVVDKGTSFLFHVNRYVAGSETDMYKHGYAELLYVSDGSLTEHVCGDKVHIKKGDVCFINSGCVHKESFEEDDTFVIRLEVSDEIINAVISNAMADKQAVDYIKELVKVLKNSGYIHFGYKDDYDNELKDIPVIIFSSLINEEMRRKGEQLGADMQLSKPEIGSLVEAIDKLILK